MFLIMASSHSENGRAEISSYFPGFVKQASPGQDNIITEFILNLSGNQAKNLLINSFLFLTNQKIARKPYNNQGYNFV